MCIVKTKRVNRITVNIHNDYIPKEKEKYKENLKVVYDTMNLIFKDLEKDNLFYTEKELKKIIDKNKEVLI